MILGLGFPAKDYLFREIVSTLRNRGEESCFRKSGASQL